MEFNELLHSYIDKTLDEIIKKNENDLMVFLKQNGYRPKPTKEYFTRLRRNLKRKGLVLVQIHPNKKHYNIIGNFVIFEKNIFNIIAIEEYNNLKRAKKHGL